MRTAALAAAMMIAAFTAACGPGEIKVNASNKDGASVSANLGGEAGGYTLNVIDDGAGALTYLVIKPDGSQVAAVGDDKGARLVEGGDAHAAMSETAGAMSPPSSDEKVAIKMPGVSINVAGNGENDGERSKVEIIVGGKSIQVDAEGPDGSERAVVKIGGADEAAVRNFIDEAKKLTPEVKAQMREKLGL
jgi:hypothetical protein